MSALTDSMNFVSYDAVNRPGVSNLLQLLSYFDTTGRSAAELGEAHASLNLKSLKMLVAETIESQLSGVRRRYIEIMNEDGGRYVDHVERCGAAKARESAEATMASVRQAVGF